MMVDNLTITDTLTMMAPNQQDCITIKTVWVTVPNPNQPAPILRISQGMWGMKDFSCLGFLGSVSKTIVKFGSTYTNCDPTDIGKMVKDDGQDTTALAGYDNSLKEWYLAGSASIASGSTMTILNGTGAGASSENSDTRGGGAVLMGHGLYGPTDVPKIILMDSSTGFDTLFIKKPTETAAHLDLGNLTAHGDIRLYNENPGYTSSLKFGTSEVDSIGAYYPCKITQWIDSPNNYDSYLRFYVANGNYTAGTENERCTLAMSLRGDGVAYFSSAVIAGGPDSYNISLSHDYSHGYLTAHTGDLVLCANSGIVRTGTINPASGSNTGKVGNHSSAYWNEIAGYDIWGHTSHLLDAYDDLALVKQWGEEKPKLENYDASKIAPPEDDIFSILRLDYEGNVSANKELFNFGQLANFALGCAKALAKKQDEHDALFLKLLNDMDSLRSEITSLKNAKESD